MSEEKACAEELIREEETAHGVGEIEEAEGRETVLEEEHTEENTPVEKEPEENVSSEEKPEESVPVEKEPERNVPAEEIIYTEGEGKEDMTELDYEAAEESKLDTELFEEEPKRRGFFRRSREEANFLRDKWILSRIRDEDLMDYLVLEQKRNEQLQKARDIRERRIVSAFKLTVSLAAGVAVVYFLKDNPTIFVNILYIGGILGGFWFWKNPREK